ncbi:MAG: SDR family oxidoreductase, partial [Mesorhizobium sp.]
MAVNLRGPFLMAKYVVPEMRRIGSGTIVNIGSVEGYMVNPWHTAYHKREPLDAGNGGAIVTQIADDNHGF